MHLSVIGESFRSEQELHSTPQDASSEYIWFDRHQTCSFHFVELNYEVIIGIGLSIFVTGEIE